MRKPAPKSISNIYSYFWSVECACRIGVNSESAMPSPQQREEVLFALALEKPAGIPGASRLVQTSVNPKHALMRWTNARRRAAPRGADTAPAPIQPLLLHRYIRSHFTNVSQSRPSAPFSTTSFSRADRLTFWLEPINTLTSGARATRSGWLMMTAGRTRADKVAGPDVPLVHSASTFKVEARAVRRSARLPVWV